MWTNEEKCWGHLSSSFPSEIMFDLEASASVFKAHLIFYTFIIYLHIDLKAGFIVHAITNQTKTLSSTHRMHRSLWNCVMVPICPKRRSTFWERNIMIFLRAKIAKYCSTLLRKAQNHLWCFLSNNSLNSRIYGTSNVLNVHNSEHTSI